MRVFFAAARRLRQLLAHFDLLSRFSSLLNSKKKTKTKKASLANRDFSAEKACDAVIIGPTLVENGGTGAGGGPTLSAEERDAAEAAAADALKLPRRPKWSPEMSAAELDARERAAFVSWRRALAAIEASGTIPLTPFEKNLDVWRQLWR